MTPEEWDAFLAGYRRWVRRFVWVWPVLVVLVTAVVIWRFGT